MTNDTESIRDDTCFVSVAKMTVDVLLFHEGVGFSGIGHGGISERMSINFGID